MKTYPPGFKDVIETVDTIKSGLEKNFTGNDLCDILTSCFNSHPVALFRTFHGEPLFSVVLDHIESNGDRVSLVYMAQSFFRFRALGKYAEACKRHLVSHIRSPITIAALFELILTDADVMRIAKTAEQQEILPGLWSKAGLKYQAWLDYSELCIERGMPLESEYKALVAAASNKITAEPAKIDQNANISAEFSWSEATVRQIELLQKDPMNLPQPEFTEWKKLLLSPELAVRSAMANAIAVYVATNEYQDSALAALISFKKDVSAEIFLQCVGQSCVNLARKSVEMPARFPNEHLTQRKRSVLPLTQTMEGLTRSQSSVNGYTKSVNGVWSYFDIMQGQNLLYSTLVDMCKEGEPISLFTARQFKTISKALNKTPWQLCQPYWPWLAPAIVKHYNRKYVDWFCESILEVSRKDFLLRVSGIIIPHACFDGSPEQMRLCEDIAGYRICKIRRIFIDHAAAIIAKLLMQSTNDVDQALSYAEDQFVALDRTFRNFKFSSFLASWRVDVIYEILMLTREDNASLAIGLINKIMDFAYEEVQDDAHEILQQMIFRLVVKFSETMRNLMGRQPQYTKLFALFGLHVLIEYFITPRLLASVLRQLTAFLQATFENSALSLAALKAWLSVVRKLEDDKLESIIDLTFAIINERSQLWDREAVAMAFEIVSHIRDRMKYSPQKFIKIHPETVFDDHFDGSNDLDANPSFDILQSLIERDTENTYLALQTARDLCSFGLKYQKEIIEWTHSDGSGQKLLGQAVRILFNLCSKADGECVQMIAARALGFFGALDPHRTDIEPRETMFVLRQNFSNESEVVEFCRILVKHWFLPAFEAATNPTVQRYFAYGIQEILKFVEVETELRLKEIFKDYGLVTTLLPLIKTKYTLDLKFWTEPKYPIYSTHRGYTEWLAFFCSDMMRRTSNPEPATRIFDWCRKVLIGSHAGPEFWAFLLPFAALAALVDKNEMQANREIFLREILLVLSLSGHTLQPYHERIFAILDYFNQWVAARRQAREPLLNMEHLISQIPASLMAQRALECNSYPRAVRYFEKQAREDSEARDHIVKNLRHIYASMQDVDALEGITVQMPTLSVEQQALEYRATSQWDAALACYNALPVSDETMVASLQCLQRSGREKEALVELSAEQKSPGLATLATECAWTVGDWESLEKWTVRIGDEMPKSWTSNMNQLPPECVQALGNALTSLMVQDLDGFKNSLDIGHRCAGAKIGDVVATHDLTSLRQVRELMVYLHGLVDVESLGAVITSEDWHNPSEVTDEQMYKNLKDQLEMRLRVMSPLNEGPEFQAKRFLLKLRNAAVECLKPIFPFSVDLIAEGHLTTSKAARLHGQSSISLMEIAAAKELKNEDADAERAHLLWSQGESRSAIRTMQALIPPEYFSSPKKYPNATKNAFDLTIWKDIAAQSDSTTIVDQYTAVIKAAPTMGDAYYRLAKHYVKMYDEATEQGRANGVIAKNIVHNFTKALTLGTPQAGEALPKMLTTWLDLGIVPENLSSQDNFSRKHSISVANKDILHWGEIIDRKLIYTAIPQLLSRHMHQLASIRNLVKQLIVLVVQQYPHHSLWPVLSKGSRSEAITSDAIGKLNKTDQPAFSAFLTKAAKLVEKLNKICKFDAKMKSSMHLSQFGENFRPALKGDTLAIPVQTVMTSLENISFFSIEDHVVIQNSMQWPKRIKVWGSDGLIYQLLLKGTDDVRKDARLIEFTSAVNQLLKSDAVAAARHLDITTYRVTPLSDNSGIIEWVDGAVPARSIMNSLSPIPRLGYDSPLLKKMINVRADLQERVKAFRGLEELVSPVLWEWFVETFPDPESWLEARTRYSRSLAVMSMVGYILGLGDRHLENILLVTNSGAVLHVDFDCLFDKGKHLTIPEIVPFRLTQQFRDALGLINGYEGTFRKVCELTLRLVQSNEDLLMVVLESFVYDPVVQEKRLSPTSAMESTRSKIRGIKDPNSVPLSIDGLVDELIKQATSPENLAQMFKGWHSWI